jgi:hypothetical protein
MNNYGLSKKTNITIAAITAMATTTQHWQGLVAIGTIAIIATTYQFILDYTGKNKS